MAKIIWTEEASAWLKSIHDYIAEDSPQNANSVIKGSYNKCLTLQHYPKIGSTFMIEPEGTIRILRYGHYRITYLETMDENILIIGVFHDALKIDRYLP